MNQFTTSDFFVLRTPLLPFQEFLALSAGLSFAQALHNGSDLSSAVVADRKQVRARLQELVERPEVKEALWLASPEFCESLSIWKKEPESANGQKLERALYRYVARMTSRPTPFGLFAGCSLGKIASETRLEIGPRAGYWRRSRLDMEYLCNLAEKISFDPLRHNQLHFRPNTSLYLAAGRYHHAQSYTSNEVRCYRLIATEHTTYLAATLERATGGATPVELAQALVKDDPEISLQEAEEYVRQLIQSQMLVSELVPPITGGEPIGDMLVQLEGSQDPSVSDALKSVSERLHKLDQRGVGNDMADYQEIVNTISPLPCKFKLDHLVQVDMMKTAAHVSLDQRLIRDILRGVDVLHSLSPSSPPDPFKGFKEDFHERYQDQAVPLLLALDDEVGIGFERKEGPEVAPEPLIDDIDFSGADEDSTFKARKSEFILMRKLEELAEQKKTTLELDKKLLEALRTENPLPLPQAFAVIGHLIGSANAQENKLSFHLQGVSGPSGALLLGRFCHADERLTACVQRHLRAEEEIRAGEDVVYAEVAHLPEGRIGNVLCRPMLRRYEIPFLATSRAPLDQQIPVTDLTVSIENDRVVLRSQRLGCEVLPRLTSAHGYQHGRNLKVYKFLCVLQTQGVSGGMSWDWGILEQAAFLPRVTFGNIVLASARWRMSKEVIETLARERGAERLNRIDAWRNSKGVPRFALLTEADNQLLIDFDNVLSVETLIEYIKKRESARLVEMAAGPDCLSACGPEGKFTHEVVIPFVRRKDQPVRSEPATVANRNQIRPAPAIRAAKTERNFLPGSEWLFAKIYASPSQADRLLVEQIKPLVARVLAAKTADNWFFIRYSDPHGHLRLRFHGMPGPLSTKVLPELWECIERQRQQDMAWRMQIDTYERELERYGGMRGTLIAERLFQLDSELVLDLLEAIADQLGAEIRWHLAFASVDCLLSGLGLDLSARHALVNSLGKSQEKNFAVQQIYRKQVSEKFRKERQALERLLETAVDSAGFPAQAQSALTRFAGQLKTIRGELEAAQEAGELTKPIAELAGSYVHMHLNRMFRSAANAQEMVLYDFLARTYDSKLAREKTG
ncbi:MAG TPA: lantibiotic dehydratase [Candidatus Angelobacter sp.]|nr:lantibiotic dehydratase [Candidatus Angelobacter sp.]